MDINILRQVAAIVETGSFSGAARKLGVSQPTLSKNIARLEDRLGKNLFVRRKGVSQAAPLARYLASQAEPLIKEMDYLFEAARGFRSGEDLQLRLGLGPIAARLYLPELIKRLKDYQSDVQISIITGATSQLVQSLDRGELDLIICHKGAGLEARRHQVSDLEDMAMLFVTAPDHPILSIQVPSITTLFSYPAALPHMTPGYEQMLKTLYGVDVHALTNIVFTSDYQVLRALALSAGYFTAGPERVFTAALKAGDLVNTGLILPFRHEIVTVRSVQSADRPLAMQTETILQDMKAELISI